SVERLVLTSTVSAIFGDYADVLSMKNETLTEDYFNTTSTPENNPYHYAKTVAEQAAWELAGAQDRWSMVTVNPGLILGPSLTPVSDSGSLFLMNELMSGYFFYGAPAAALPSSTCATRQRRTSGRRRTRPPPAGTSWPGPRWCPSTRWPRSSGAGTRAGCSSPGTTCPTPPCASSGRVSDSPPT